MLLRRVQAEDTGFRYGGQVTVSQRVPYLGQFSLISYAERRDFSSHRRADFLDFSGDLRFSYRHEIFTRPQKEFVLEGAQLNMYGASYTYQRQLFNLEKQVVASYYDSVSEICQLEIRTTKLGAI